MKRASACFETRHFHKGFKLASVMSQESNENQGLESEIVQIRLDRLQRLKDGGQDPFAQTRFERTQFTADIVSGVETLDGQEARLSGRIKSRRGQGKIAFADLYDPSGKLQLIAQIDRLGEEKMAAWKALELGDILGVTGIVGKSRSGEPSLFVTDWVLLSVSIQPLPDKYHGLQDVELRYRQRYADLLANDDVVEVFKKRSQIVREMRRILDDQGFMEVETPMMQAIPGGAAARPFITHHNALDIPLFLRIAPELYLKRLVVGGLERVYEINRNFRNEGIDTTHNPEFTMMECYQAFADYHDMMDLTENMIRDIAETVNGTTNVEVEGREIDLGAPWKRATMQELVFEKIGVNLTGYALIEAFEKHIEENLIEPTFVLDFPVENSPLAKRKVDDERFTYRFEVFIGGSEIGNAFSELNDPVDQAERFSQQAKQKAKGDVEAQAYDDDYIRALQYGLPPCGGLGIGIDRLVMLLTNNPSIREVILFPLLRPERSGVSSSAVSEQGYDIEKRALTLKWQGGGVYEYRGVSPELYIRFLQSDSKGAFANQQIKGHFSERRVA